MFGRRSSFLVVGAVAMLVGSCGSDPVADDPDLVGVATVRDLKELPTASILAPEVSGPREVRFRYSVLSCGEAPALPAKVEATYTVDTVAFVVTPAPLDCGPTEDPGESERGLEVFLAETVGDRDVSGSTEAP